MTWGGRAEARWIVSFGGLLRNLELVLIEEIFFIEFELEDSVGFVQVGLFYGSHG